MQYHIHGNVKQTTRRITALLIAGLVAILIAVLIIVAMAQHIASTAQPVGKQGGVVVLEKRVGVIEHEAGKRFGTVTRA